MPVAACDDDDDDVMMMPHQPAGGETATQIGNTCAPHPHPRLKEVPPKEFLSATRVQKGFSEFSRFFFAYLNLENPISCLVFFGVVFSFFLKLRIPWDRLAVVTPR